jgi:hypothetical protein
MNVQALISRKHVIEDRRCAERLILIFDKDQQLGRRASKTLRDNGGEFGDGCATFARNLYGVFEVFSNDENVHASS